MIGKPYSTKTVNKSSIHDKNEEKNTQHTENQKLHNGQKFFTQVSNLSFNAANCDGEEMKLENPKFLNSALAEYPEPLQL